MKIRSHPACDRARGLTLIELLVVLTILAALATIAITSSAGLADQARYEATQRTLQNVKTAVMGSTDLRDPDGRILVGGFLADVGRLPQAASENRNIDGINTTVFTLAELWTQPTDTAPYGFHQAADGNIVSETGDPGLLKDEDVYLSYGWRGPYLELPVGKSDLYDGWGSELATPSGAAPAALRGQSGASVSASSPQIWQVVSAGANSEFGQSDTGYDQDQPSLVFSTAATSSQLSVTVNIWKADGSPLDVDSGEVEVRLFSPDSMSQKIRVIPYPGQPFSGSALVFPMPISSYPVTPGNRVVRAYYHDSGGITHASAVTPLLLLPGSNSRYLTITLPASP